MRVLTIQAKALLSFFSDLQPLAIFQFKLNAYIVSLLCKAVKKEYELC